MYTVIYKAFQSIHSIIQPSLKIISIGLLYDVTVSTNISLKVHFPQVTFIAQRQLVGRGPLMLGEFYTETVCCTTSVKPKPQHQFKNPQNTVIPPFRAGASRQSNS